MFQNLRRSARRSAARKKKYVDDIDLNLSDSDHDNERLGEGGAAATKEDPVVALQERGEPVPLHLTHFQVQAKSASFPSLFYVPSL